MVKVLNLIIQKYNKALLINSDQLTQYAHFQKIVRLSLGRHSALSALAPILRKAKMGANLLLSRAQAAVFCGH